MVVLTWLACHADRPDVPAPAPSDPTVPTSDPTTEEPPTAAALELVVSSPHERANDRQVDVHLSAEAPAALLCVARDEPDDRFLFESPAATDHTFAVQALRYGATYDCAAGPVEPFGPEAIAHTTIEVGPSPGFDPPVAVTGSPVPDGWVLTTVTPGGGCGGGTTLAIFDTAGRLRWNYPVPTGEIDVEVLHLGGGVLLYGGATNLPGPAEVHVWDGEVLASDLPGDHWFHHDAKALGDGRILTLSEEENTQGDYTWIGFLVRAWDPLTGRVSSAYHSQQGVDDGVLIPAPDDAWHANWVESRSFPDGDKLYVSLCDAQRVLQVDVTTGIIDWVFGADGDLAIVDAAGDPLPRSQFTQCQHGLEVSDDGTRFLMYDNGVERGASRVVEFAIDADTKVAQRLWQWEGDGWFEDSLGDADWLPDGDVLVTRAHPECWSDGDPSAIIAFDPVSGDEHWRMSFLDRRDATYRSQRLDGCELFSNVGQCVELEPRWTTLAPSFGVQ